MEQKINKIAVIGGGGWGTALALLAIQNIDDVILYTRDSEVAVEINNLHTNQTFLPNISLNENLKATSDPSALESYDYIINTVPTQFIKEHYKKIAFNFEGKYIINGSKGIDNMYLKTISDIFLDLYNVPKSNYAVLSGPSHAEEVAAGMPTTVLVASENLSFANLVQQSLSNNLFRIYTSQDVIGCEIGGSLKNVIAIAAGMIDGIKLGDNTKAALITRGLAEIARLGVALGGNAQTFSGLSGMGDLIVTCQSRHSRNRTFGEAIGRGEKSSKILSQMKMVVEGVETSKAIHKLKETNGIEMPISEQVYQIIFEDKDPNIAICDLMKRVYKSE